MLHKYLTLLWSWCIIVNVAVPDEMLKMGRVDTEVIDKTALIV